LHGEHLGPTSTRAARAMQNRRDGLGMTPDMKAILWVKRSCANQKPQVKGSQCTTSTRSSTPGAAAGCASCLSFVLGGVRFKIQPSRPKGKATLLAFASALQQEHYQQGQHMCVHVVSRKDSLAHSYSHNTPCAQAEDVIDEDDGCQPHCSHSLRPS
jgi:hypothetical protein